MVNRKIGKVTFIHLIYKYGLNLGKSGLAQMQARRNNGYLL